MIPLFPLYAEKYHPSAIQFGLLMSSFSAMQFVFAPLLGRLSDRHGRRPVLLLSLFGTAVSYLVFAFAGSLAALFAARIVAGMAGANIGTAQAVIADVTTPDERARGMGIVGAAFGLGFIFGPAIGGFTVGISHAAPGLAAAALSFTAFVWAYLRLPETRPAGTRERAASLLPVRALARAFSRPEIGGLLALALLATTAFSSFEATFAQYLHARFGLGASTVAGVFVVVGVVSTFVQGFLVRRLVTRVGELRLVVAGLSLLALGFLTLLVAPGRAALLLGVVLLAVGSGLFNPSLSGLVSRRSAAHEQGEVLGSFQSMSALGRIGGPLWGEKAFFRYGPAGPHASAAAIEALGLGLLAFLTARENRVRQAVS